jgi:hypothetical protein
MAKKMFVVMGLSGVRMANVWTSGNSLHFSPICEIYFNIFRPFIQNYLPLTHCEWQSGADG